MKYDEPPPGWQFYHANLDHNIHLAPGWAESNLSQFPEDLRDTRRIGTFSTFQGQVFKEWRPRLHIVEPFTIPKDWRRVRGIDFGYNNPFCCTWSAQNPQNGRWYVYREHYESGRLNGYHVGKINEVGKC